MTPDETPRVGDTMTLDAKQIAAVLKQCANPACRAWRYFVNHEATLCGACRP